MGKGCPGLSPGSEKAGIWEGPIRTGHGCLALTWRDPGASFSHPDPASMCLLVKWPWLLMRVNLNESVVGAQVPTPHLLGSSSMYPRSRSSFLCPHGCRSAAPSPFQGGSYRLPLASCPLQVALRVASGELSNTLVHHCPSYNFLWLPCPGRRPSSPNLHPSPPHSPREGECTWSEHLEQVL